MKILILASNPLNDLKLDEEIRDLQDVINDARSHQSVEFEVEVAPAVRAKDLQDLLLRHQPQIVHFCGHGGGEEGLILEGDHGPQWVTTEALREFFFLFKDQVKCVLLNACYSEEQADEIVNHINYVIGMNQAIRDDAAIAFSQGFYRALAYDRPIETAFKFGCNAIQLALSGESPVPVIERKLNTPKPVQPAPSDQVQPVLQDIPEHLKPVLKKRVRTGTTVIPEPRPTGIGTKELVVPVPVPDSDPKPDPDPKSDRTLYPKLDQNQWRLLVIGLVFGAFSIITALAITQGKPKTAVPPSPPPSLVPSPPLEIPPTNPSASRIPSQLEAANRLMQDEEYRAILRLLKDIAEESIPDAHKLNYQSLLNLSSGKVLDSAQSTYDRGEIDAALVDVGLIPKNSASYPRAQKLIAAWSPEKDAVEKLNDPVLKVSSGKKIEETLKLIKNPVLVEEAKSVIKQAEESKSAMPVPAPPAQPSPTIAAQTAKWEDYKYSWLSTRPVIEDDLKDKSDAELDIMRNSPYARHGLIFGPKVLKEAFAQEAWYQPTNKLDKVGELIEKQEKANAFRIKDYQDKRAKANSKKPPS